MIVNLTYYIMETLSLEHLDSNQIVINQYK